MDIVSTITSKHIERIVIGIAEAITDARLQTVIESKKWDQFDEAITRLADQTSNNGRRLQLELHVCGNPSTELFNALLPRFVESGSLKIVKASYIWKGSVVLPSLSYQSEITRFV